MLVWPDHHEAVLVFAGCLTQWRVSMSGVTGLDYTAVRTVMQIHGVENELDCLEKIQTMESAALEAINERR